MNFKKLGRLLRGGGAVRYSCGNTNCAVLSDTGTYCIDGR